jgi:hypothetical protein
MPGNGNICRIHDLGSEIVEQRARMRAVVAKSKDLLQFGPSSRKNRSMFGKCTRP